jgi:hypothetical protein
MTLDHRSPSPFITTHHSLLETLSDPCVNMLSKTYRISKTKSIDLLKHATVCIRTSDQFKNVQVKHFSDSLIGYNPMANRTEIDKNLKKVDPVKGISPIGVDSNTEGGGVWAQTNAKREKLGELRLELNREKGELTLDDAATLEERKDLLLVDGIIAVSSIVDGSHIENADGFEGSNLYLPFLQSFESSMDDYTKSFLEGKDEEMTSIEINRDQFDTYSKYLLEELDSHDLRKKQSLINLRNTLLFRPPNDEYDTLPSNLLSQLVADSSMNECQEIFRVLLLKACLNHLSAEWGNLLKISERDVDRAATTGITIEQPTTISITKLLAVISSFGYGSCSDRVRALWNLFDKDEDGLLDQAEMDAVALMSVKPVEAAFLEFVKLSIESGPLRGNITHDKLRESDISKEKGGWFQRRTMAKAEAKAKKNFLKFTEQTIKRHFDADVEMPHRLRCTYAWAEKKHQDGKVQSVTVSDEGRDGKQRYVELDPKISYDEFRDQQKDHFNHLDRVAEELSVGLKQELWISQGKGRQRTTLKKESAAFLSVVAAIDFAIYLN